MINRGTVLNQSAVKCCLSSNISRYNSILSGNNGAGVLGEENKVSVQTKICYQNQNQCMMMSSAPFYGTPLPPSSRYDAPNSSSDTSTQQQQQHNQNQQHIPLLSPIQRIATLVHSSLTALNDPTRADAVAAVGEVTGSFALSKMLAGMESNEVGKRILNDRPIVDENIAKQAEILLQQHNVEMSTSNVNFNNPINAERTKGMSFGAAYATFLQTHKFDPNERDSVRFISDPKLSYVMTRYRQCHDYWHVLTGLPPTVLGELGLKWLELIQTGLPLAALSASSGVFGANGLSAQEREILISVYLPWAMKVGHNMKEHSLLCTYYEEELETDLDVLRERMGIEPAPIV